ncbi:MAG: DNA polymerase III subunit beta, partial [Gammaproteobacteria bacterium]|nr:DNA polymerase III subunit beta [Gammaproteobacteria bacterium]
MKLVCDRGALVESMALVGGAVVARTPKPVLTCVKITADKAAGAVTFTATDMEVGIRYTTNRVEVNDGGETLVPADKFIQIVRESVDPTLTIETDGELTHIRGEDAHFQLMGYPSSDFPPVPELTDAPDFEIEANQLDQLIHQTIYATARENSRYAINGVLFEREGNKVAVVATDGHRLALARGECRSSGGGDEKQTAIIPTKALTMLLRLLSDTDATVKSKVADNQILFATDTAVLSSNLVEGNFPPYKDVIPKDGDKTATIATNVLNSAFRRAALLTNEESKGVRMSFTSDGLKLSSRAPEMGEAEIDVEFSQYEGEPVDIGFNPQYLLDALKVADAEQVMLDLKARKADVRSFVCALEEWAVLTLARFAVKGERRDGRIGVWVDVG